MKHSKILSIVLTFFMVMTTFSFADTSVDANTIKVNVLVDNDHIRVVESIGPTERSIATFNKLTNKLSIEAIDSNQRVRNTIKIDNVMDLRSATSHNNVKSATIEVRQVIQPEKLNAIKGLASTNAATSFDLGYGGASTTYGDYGYFNLWSAARLHAGDNRSIIQVDAKYVATGQQHEANYNTFCDTIDNIRMTEQVAAVALGGEVLGAVVSLVFAPDITATKLAAALGAIGISVTLIGTFITWQFQASTARKYYDKLKPYSN